MTVSAKEYVAWTEIDAARVIVLELLDSERLNEIDLKAVFTKLDDLLMSAQATLDPAGELCKDKN